MNGETLLALIALMAVVAVIALLYHHGTPGTMRAAGLCLIEAADRIEARRATVREGHEKRIRELAGMPERPMIERRRGVA